MKRAHVLSTDLLIFVTHSFSCSVNKVLTCRFVCLYLHCMWGSEILATIVHSTGAKIKTGSRTRNLNCDVPSFAADRPEEEKLPKSPRSSRDGKRESRQGRSKVHSQSKPARTPLQNLKNQLKYNLDSGNPQQRPRLPHPTFPPRSSWVAYARWVSSKILPGHWLSKSRNVERALWLLQRSPPSWCSLSC